MHGADDAGSSAQREYTLAGTAVTLVVRAWLEPVGGAPPILRGTVAQLGGVMLGAFSSIEALAALVVRQLDAPQPEEFPHSSQ
ncbi:hypothetical protein ACFOKI_05640 [Sphingomonas qilianensis]|uniref:Uncharacterized protein n=1 Tax=Sphingomonas qilianensis TaxID=1736690 RepID=A0ABU9XRN3_9SPHN